jgi:hypothetical protein
MEGTVVEVSEPVLIQCYIALSLNGSYLWPILPEACMCPQLDHW